MLAKPHLDVRVGPGDYDLTCEVEALAHCRRDIGAVVTFEGRVRGEGAQAETGRSLVSLTLEHYPKVTEATIERHARAAIERFKLHGVRIVHRVGELKTGERIVLVATAASHRGDAFAAAEFLMDYLKSEAPFWKKERWSDGSASWVDARTSDEAAKARWS